MRKFNLFNILVFLLVVFALTACGNTQGNNECINHTWGEWTVTKEATCSEVGTKERKCSNCEETESAEVEKVDHSYTNYVNNKVSCTEDLTATAHCDFNCGATDTKFVASAVGHKHVQSSVVEATCTEDGKIIYECSCGDSYTETIKAKGHNHIKEETKKVSCTVDGLNTYKCEYCDDSYTEVVYATGHKYELTTSVDVSCTKDGENHYECQCGDSYTETVKAQGHKYVLTLSVGAECEDNGYEQYECSCGENYTVEILAHGHQYEEIDKVEVDCLTDGQTLFECVHCLDKYSVVNEHATGHTVRTWELDYENILEDCEVEQHYLGECENCFELVEKTETIVRHSFLDEVQVSSPATCKQAGVKTYYCSCGATEDVLYENENAHNWVLDSNNNNTSTVTYHCSNDGCSETKSEIIINSTQGSVSKDNLASSGVQLSTATISLDRNTLNGLADEDVTLTAEVLAGKDLDDIKEKLGEKADAIGENQIYNFGLSQSGNYVEDEFGGYVTVTVPYTLSEGEDPESIAIWYVDADGNVETIAAVYSNNTATFKVKHFSYYTVTRLSPAERCALYGHVENEYVIAPKCTEEGYTLHICQRCGISSKDQIVPATGHNLEVEVTLATCNKNGKEVHFCTNDGCRFSYTSIIAAKGHEFEETRLEPSCLVDGSVEYSCDCGFSYTVKVPATGHIYSSEVEEATCFENGLAVHTCDCGDTYTEILVATGHKWTTLEKLEPTTTQTGYIIHQCKLCGEKYTEILPKKDKEISTPNLDTLIDAINSLVDKNISLVLKDVNLIIPDSNDAILNEFFDFSGKLNIPELYLTLNDDGILVGNFITKIETTASFGYDVCELKGYVYDTKIYLDRYYIDNDRTTENNIFCIDYYYGIIGGSEIPVDFESIEEILELASSWYDESFYEIVESLKDANEENVLLSLESLISLIFDFEENESGKVITLNIGGLHELVDSLTSNTIYDVLENIFGSKILENIDLLFDYSVKEFMDLLEEKGLVLEELIASLDDLVTILAEAELLPEELQTVNDVLAYYLGEETADIMEIINSDDVQNITVGDLITMLVASYEPGKNIIYPNNYSKENKYDEENNNVKDQLTIENIKEYINEVLEECKTVTAVELLADYIGMNTDKMIEYANTIIDLIDEEIKLETILDKDNNIVSSKFIGNFDNEELNGTILFSLEYDYNAKYDNASLKEEVDELLKEIDLINNIEIILENYFYYPSYDLDIELYYNEVNELDYIEILRKNKIEDDIFDKYWNEDEKFNKYSVYYEKYIIKASDLINFILYEYSEECSGWSEHMFEILLSKETGSIVYDIIETDDGFELSNEYIEKNHVNTSIHTIVAYYNFEEKLFGNRTTACHSMEYVQELSKFPQECLDLGYSHHECSKCDYFYDRYYQRWHDLSFYDYELYGTSCEDGGNVIYKCKDCEYTESQYIEWHEYFIRYINLEEYGATCGSRLRIEGCLCGEITYINFEEICEFDFIDSVSIDEHKHFELFRCAVTDPLCGFNYAVSKYEVEEGCKTSWFEIYYFGFDEVVFNEETGYHEFVNTKYVLNVCTETYIDHKYECVAREESDLHEYTKYECPCGNYYSDEYFYEYIGGKKLVTKESHINYYVDYDSMSVEVIEYTYYKNGLVKTEYIKNGDGKEFHYHAFNEYTYYDNSLLKTIYSKHGSTPEFEYYRYGEYTYYETNELKTDYEETGMIGELEFWRLIEYVYEYGTPEGCFLHEIYSNINGESYTNTINICMYSWVEKEIVDLNHPCTQSVIHIYGEVCTRCGLGHTEVYEEHPNGHQFNWNDELEIYVCDVCGVKNEVGANGLIVLEDCTEKGSDKLTIGYYNEKGVDYMVAVTLILKTPDEFGNNEVFISDVNFEYSETGRFISFSKSEVQSMALGLGYSENEYNIRISFVPTNGYDDLDYAITFE